MYISEYMKIAICSRCLNIMNFMTELVEEGLEEFFKTINYNKQPFEIKINKSKILYEPSNNKFLVFKNNSVEVDMVCDIKELINYIKNVCD